MNLGLKETNIYMPSSSAPFLLFHGLRLSLSAVENLRTHGEGPVKRSKNQNCLTGDNRSNRTSKKVAQKTAVTRIFTYRISTRYKPPSRHFPVRRPPKKGSSILPPQERYSHEGR